MTAPLQVDVTGWLIARLAVSLDPVRVAAERPADLETQVPFVQVQRVGGGNDNYILDNATVVFHCFATTQQSANQLAYSVIGAVRALRGRASDGAVLNEARTQSGPAWASTENQGLRHAAVIMQTRIKTTG